MSNELTQPKTFEEKMKERLRNSIGDLMPDEDLKKIVERGIEEAFFHPRGDNRKGFNESFVKEVVRPLLAEKVEKVVKEYFQENPEVFERALKESIGQGIGDAFANFINNVLVSHKFQIEDSLRQAFNLGSY